MLSTNLKNVLDDFSVAKNALSGLGITDLAAAHASLVNIANQGVPLDLLEDIVGELSTQLPGTADPDLGLKNFERFIVSSRSPMSLAALLVRDHSALSALLEIFSFSRFLSDLLVEDPESFDLLRLTEGQPVSRDLLFQELQAEIRNASGIRVAKNRLRRFKRRELLRIAYGDVVRKFELERTAQQLFNLAATISEVALEFCLQRTREKFGLVRDRDGNPCGIALLGSGQAGTRNLDYFPALSVWAVYQNGVESDGKQRLRCPEYFERVLGEFDDLLSEINELGECYQVRFERRAIRGNGNACPLDELIKFYDQSATAKDRLDLVQTSFLCGDRMLGSRFRDARSQTCFRNYFSLNDLAEIQSVKQSLHAGIDEGGEFRNLRTSPGGLGDLEFTVAFLQMLVGRSMPEAQEGGFFEVLFHLEQNEVLTGQEYSALKQNYSFLKTVSHRLQLCETEPSEILPAKPGLGRRLEKHLEQYWGFSSDFQGLTKVTQVAEESLAILNHLLEWRVEEKADIWKAYVLNSITNEGTLLRALEDLGFQRAETALKSISLLAEERHRFIPSKRCRFFLASILSNLLKKISQVADPDQTLYSLAVVSDSLGGKGTLWELFRESGSCMDLYVKLCAYTPYLTLILQSNPGMLDELMDSLTTGRLENAEGYQDELDMICGNSVDLHPILVAFKNSKHLQIGVSQLVGNRNLNQVHTALADVADCCIQKVAESEMRFLVERHGQPTVGTQPRVCEYGIVVGGKVGMREPNYHSHAAFWLLYEAEGKTDARRNQKSISNQQFFTALTTRVAKMLSQTSSQGRLYELEEIPKDFGDSKTTAMSIQAFENRLENRRKSAPMMMFLGCCRVLSGSPEFCRQSEKVISSGLVHCKLDQESWDSVWSQRLQMEKGAFLYNLKRGRGGTLDVETLIHFLYAVAYRDLNQTTHTAKMLDELVSAGIIRQEDGKLLKRAYEKFKLIELCLRLMNLRRRHALPVLIEENDHESDDQAIAGSATAAPTTGMNSAGSLVFNGGNFSGKPGTGFLGEIVDIQSLTVQQMRLAVLMHYDRFDAIRDEVEVMQNDNRQLVESIIESYWRNLQ